MSKFILFALIMRFGGRLGIKGGRRVNRFR